MSALHPHAHRSAHPKNPPPPPPPRPPHLPVPAGRMHCVQVEHSTRTTNESMNRLIRQHDLKPEQIYEALCSQTVDLVMTAHPTQARPGISSLCPSFSSSSCCCPEHCALLLWSLHSCSS